MHTHMCSDMLSASSVARAVFMAVSCSCAPRRPADHVWDPCVDEWRGGVGTTSLPTSSCACRVLVSYQPCVAIQTSLGFSHASFTVLRPIDLARLAGWRLKRRSSAMRRRSPFKAGILLLLTISSTAATDGQLHGVGRTVSARRELLIASELRVAQVASAPAAVPNEAYAPAGAPAVRVPFSVLRMLVAYVLWALFGIFGAHHLYLGRNCEALVSSISLNGFLLGWVRDAFRIPSYVRQLGQAEAEAQLSGGSRGGAFDAVGKLRRWAIETISRLRGTVSSKPASREASKPFSKGSLETSPASLASVLDKGAHGGAPRRGAAAAVADVPAAKVAPNMATKATLNMATHAEGPPLASESVMMASEFSFLSGAVRLIYRLSWHLALGASDDL